MNTFCCGCSLRSGVRYFIPGFIVLLGGVQLLIFLEEELLVGAIVIFLLQLASALLSFVSTTEITDKATRNKISLCVIVLILVFIVISVIEEIEWLLFDMEGSVLEGLSEVIYIFTLQGVFIYFAFVEFTYSRAVANGSIHATTKGRGYVTNVVTPGVHVIAIHDEN